MFLGFYFWYALERRDEEEMSRFFISVVTVLQPQGGIQLEKLKSNGQERTRRMDRAGKSGGVSHTHTHTGIKDDFELSNVVQ